MKKILIIILIIGLGTLAYVVIANGIHLGKVNVLSYKEIGNEYKALEDKIQEANKLVTVEYPGKLSSLTSANKQLLSAKEDYENLTKYSSASEIEEAQQEKTYEIEYLWATIGNYATAEGLDIKLEVTPGSSGVEGLYNINFIASGPYIAVADFVSEIENDSSLGFKIEQFKLVPITNNTTSDETNNENANTSTKTNNIITNLTGTFTITNVKIKDIGVTTISKPKTEIVNEQENTGDGDNTNTSIVVNNTNTNVNNTAR